jgi:arylsulfatase A-like enzyme
MTGEDRLNVAIIVLDALRPDHVSCYGYPKPTTPNLDAFAAGGTRFSVDVSAGVWTFPSVISLFTGLYPSQHGMNRANRPIAPELRLLAERLQTAGYRTGGFSANPYVGHMFDLDRGFEVFREFWGFSGRGAQARTNNLLSIGSRWLWPRLRTVVKRSKTLTGAYHRYLQRRVEARDKGGRALVESAYHWVGEARRRQQPFFLFAHLMEAHAPLAPPVDYLRKFMDAPAAARARRVNQDAMAYMAGVNPLDDEDFGLILGLYDASISYGDEQLGRLLDALDDDTLVIITADHGNSFGEHGVMDHFFSVHETLASVPLVVSHPGLPTGVIERPVQSIDIAPTVLEAAGVDVVGLAGVSLCASADPRPCLVTEFLDPDLARFDRFRSFDPVAFRRDLRALRRGHHKYIWASDGREELYDLREDPLEGVNRAATEPVLLAEFRKLHETWAASTSTALVPAQQPGELELQDDVAASLRALGYLD